MCKPPDKMHDSGDDRDGSSDILVETPPPSEKEKLQQENERLKAELAESHKKIAKAKKQGALKSNRPLIGKYKSQNGQKEENEDVMSGSSNVDNNVNKNDSTHQNSYHSSNAVSNNDNGMNDENVNTNNVNNNNVIKQNTYYQKNNNRNDKKEIDSDVSNENASIAGEAGEDGTPAPILKMRQACIEVSEALESIQDSTKLTVTIGRSVKIRGEVNGWLSNNGNLGEYEDEFHNYCCLLKKLSNKCNSCKKEERRISQRDHMRAKRGSNIILNVIDTIPSEAQTPAHVKSVKERAESFSTVVEQITDINDKKQKEAIDTYNRDDDRSIDAFICHLWSGASRDQYIKWQKNETYNLSERKVETKEDELNGLEKIKSKQHQNSVKWNDASGEEREMPIVHPKTWDGVKKGEALWWKDHADLAAVSHSHFKRNKVSFRPLKVTSKSLVQVLLKQRLLKNLISFHSKNTQQNSATGNKNSSTNSNSSDNSNSNYNNNSNSNDNCNNNDNSNSNCTCNSNKNSNSKIQTIYQINKYDGITYKDRKFVVISHGSLFWEKHLPKSVNSNSYSYFI